MVKGTKVLHANIYTENEPDRKGRALEIAAALPEVIIWAVNK